MSRQLVSYLQGRRLHNLLGQPVSVLNHPHSKKIPPSAQVYFTTWVLALRSSCKSDIPHCVLVLLQSIMSLVISAGHSLQHSSTVWRFHTSVFTQYYIHISLNSSVTNLYITRLKSCRFINYSHAPYRPFIVINVYQLFIIETADILKWVTNELILV